MENLKREEIEAIREATVFPPRYRNSIVTILESSQNTEDIYITELHSLSSLDVVDFVKILLSSIQTSRMDNYYFSRYIKPRQFKIKPYHDESPLDYSVRYVDSFPESLRYILEKEFYLASLHSPKQQRLLEDYPQTFLEYLEPGSFPNLDSWIKRKRNELQGLIPLLEEAKKGFLEEQERKEQLDFQIRPPEDYKNFPASLIANQRPELDLQNWRIKKFKTFAQLSQHLSVPLDSFSKKFGKDKMEAFVYNSFDFSENKTTPMLLELNKNDEIKYNSVLRIIRSIAEQAKDANVEYQQFAKTLFLNYGNYRKSDKDLNKYFKNLATKLSRLENKPKK